MPRALVTRRLTALTAATALLSAAGLASGALAGIANAETATSVSPSAVSNATAGDTTLTIHGSGFNQLLDSVTLVPTQEADEVKKASPITGTVDKQNSSSTELIVTAPLTLAAPEPYDVVVDGSALPTGTVSTCAACLLVTNPGRPTVTGVAADGGAGSIIISGTNFARGAKVSWLTPSLGTPTTYAVDPQMTFVAGHDTSSGHTTGYPTGTTIKGVYTPGTTQSPGQHFLKITNTDGQGSTQLVEFWQPKITGTSPLTLGQGATNVPVTVTGQGIRAGSRLSISNFSSTKPDITVGTATVTGSTSISAPVSVDTTGGASTRTAYILGPDGGYVSGTSLAVTVAPNPSGGLDVKNFGQGAVDAPAKITGTGFATGVVFTGGDGVTFVTKTVAGDGTSAEVKVSVAPTATVGDRDALTATNPDHGTGSLGVDNTIPVSPVYPFTIDNGPVVTSITPGGLTPGQSKPITLAGTGFVSPMTLASTGGLTFNNVVVSSATAATATATTAPDAATGPRDVTVVNTGDRGQYACLGCLGVDGLTISPAGAANTSNGFDVTLTAAGSNTFTGATGGALHKTGSPVYQPDLTGVLTGGTATTANLTFDLTNAAPGRYDAVLTKSVSGVTSRLSCTACFTITGTDFTLAATTPLLPATGGQGAKDFPITLHGTKFVRGEKISIAGTTVSDTTFVDSTTLTATITIPQKATVGQVDVIVSSADGAFTHTLAKGYTIVAAPTVTSASTPAADHKSIGEGATSQAVAIAGTGFSAGHAAFSGLGVTATTVQNSATALTATVSVASDPAAAPIGARDLTVTNTDNGGTSLPLVGAITVTAKPVVTSALPTKMTAGQSNPSFTINGSGFKSDSLPTIAGVTLSGTTISADGNTITATAVVAKAAADGVRPVTVRNSDGGTGVCADCFTVVIPTTLTNALPASAASGSTVVETGKLTNSNTGAGVGNVSVIVRVQPKVGGATTVAAVTNSAGNWRFSFRPRYNSTSTVSFSGSPTKLAATAVARAILVSTRVTVTSPRPGASSKATSVLVITGGTSPDKYGRIAYLYRVVSGHLQTVARAGVARNGTFTFKVRLAKGGYTLRIGVLADSANSFGYSSLFTHHRV